MFNKQAHFRFSALLNGLVYIIITGFVTSCVSPKKLTENAIYFKNTSDSTIQQAVLQYQSKIQKGDILYIAVLTANENSSRLLNQPNLFAGGLSSGGGAVGNPNSVTTIGYLVDEKGNITFPYMGQINVEGFTKDLLRDSITNTIRKYVSDAIVTIRLLNYRVTILGEVARPGSFSIPSERLTILDAIGLAGDLTVFGKRDNIRIIREVNGKRETGVLDLNKGQIFDSPYFYLRQNDIVYVEMNNRKMVNADQTNSRNLSLALGALSAISLIITLATQFN